MNNANLKNCNLILASGSPRRIEMMKHHGYDVNVMPSGIEENLPDFLNPWEATMFLSLSKALDVKNKVIEKEQKCETLIIAADTVVAFGNQILGKPKDEQDALQMLLPLSGKSHQVITGVTLAFFGSCLDSNLKIPTVTKCFYESTTVFFKELPEPEIKAYVKTDEPYDKAGGYAIQETFSKYIDHIEGDLDNVVGFPWKRFLKECAR